MTVDGMHDYVRTYLDNDDEDLPDTLLDVWRDEAVARIQRSFEPWAMFEHAWTFTASDRISFDEIGATDPDGFVPEVIQSVEADRWLLRFVPHERQVAKYAWSNAVAGNPTEFSLFDGELFIWPVPNGEATYTARGYRKPVLVRGDGTVDLPAEFDPLVCEWMLTRAYEWQDDEVMSQQKLARFERQLDLLRRRYLRAPKPGVQQIGQGHDSPVLPDRLLYSWEW
jgi:hypothetical protein